MRCTRLCTSAKSGRASVRHCRRTLSIASRSASDSTLKLLHIDDFPLALPKCEGAVILQFTSCKDHRFPVGTWSTTSQILRKEYTTDDIDWEAAKLADAGLLKAVHEADYVDRFLEGRMTEAESRELGFQWSQQLVNRQLVQGTQSCAVAMALIDTPSGCHCASDTACTIVRYALTVTHPTGDTPNGIAGVIGGGLHHAKKARGSGYCALNDIAVAVQHGLNAFRVKRALIVDLDVHQGDGTASIFAEEERVVTFSMHGRKNFPFRKAVSTHDVELEEYLKLLSHWLDHLLRIHKPELVMYQSGVDALKGDRLGKLSLSRDCLRKRTEILLDMIATRSPASKLVITLGGGYAAHCDVYRAVITWLKSRPKQETHAPTSNAPLW